eukprot:331152-Rhodomonas_salina.1
MKSRGRRARAAGERARRGGSEEGGGGPFQCNPASGTSNVGSVSARYHQRAFSRACVGGYEYSAAKARTRLGPRFERVTQDQCTLYQGALTIAHLSSCRADGAELVDLGAVP